MNAPLLEVTNLVKRFPIRSGLLFERTVGEIAAVNDDQLRDRSRARRSGSSASRAPASRPTGYCILQLLKPTSGSVRFEGTELTDARPRGAAQDAARDADRLPGPVLVARPADDRRRHRRRAADRARDRHAQGPAIRIRELLDVVGFNPSFTNRYPHEFSGGQRQRIGIARALALSPKLIVCDEPVSALDVSIQAQILNLLKDLQRDFGLTYLFIAHDLAVVRSMSDRIAVMNKGKLVEIGPAEQVYTNPQDDYTKALLSAVPIPDPRAMKERKAARRKLRHALSRVRSAPS